MTRLIIENQEVELDKSVQFAITKQFEDLSNPTAIINDWSKTVSIPFTQKNNNLFGNIYKTDRLIVTDGTDKNTGIYFNPTLKMDFRLQYGDNVIMTGYAKMNEIKQKDGKGTYEITLFGELGKIIQELKKISFDNSADDTTYLIHGERYVDDYITNSLVYNSWTSSGQTHEELKEKGDTGYNVTDIIGFAPSNSSKEGFDFTTFQATDEDGEVIAKTFQDALNEGIEGFPTFEEVTGISPSTVIPNGISPRGMGEYRSYLQLPYIYWNKLFKIFQNKAESLTGYNFKLDSTWFNKKNPYWYNLVYMLKQFDIKDGGTSINAYKSIGHHPYADTIPPNTTNTAYSPKFFVDGAFAYRYIYDGTKSQWTTTRNIPITSNHYEKTESVPLIQGNMRLKLTPNERVVTQVMHVKGSIEVFFGNHYIAGVPEYGYYSWQCLNFDRDAALNVNILFTGANGVTRRQVGIVCDSNPTTAIQNLIETNSSNVCYINASSRRPNSAIDGTTIDIRRTGTVWDYTLNFPETNLFYAEFGDYVDISIETFYSFGNSAQIPFTKSTVTVDGNAYGLPDWDNKYQIATVVNFNSEMRITTDVFRSGSKFTLNDLWNKDISVFDEILRYCKMFRIGVKVDESNKQLLFTPIERYFKNYTVTDWTNKIDMSKDFNITPITFEDKYILFNYENGGTKNNKVYKEKYGYNYGEYRLTTDYNFNNKTNKLFEGQKPSIIISPIILTWDTLFRQNKILYRIPTNESYVDDSDKENKMVDTFGQFYFHNGLNYFTKTDMPAVYISDDTKLMTWNQTYFYTGGFYEEGTFLFSDTYPNLSLYRDDNMITFAIPKESYVHNVSYSNKKGIYDNLWESYLNERYNIQNKKITCYAHINPIEFSTFDWNKLVKVGNQLCIVNKIYDYDVTSSQPTKVDLITIQNINGYTTNNFLNNLDTLDLDWSTTVYIRGESDISGTAGTFSSLSQVTFNNGTTTYTVGGVKFTIVNNTTVRYETVSKYIEREDLDVNITLKNETNHTASFHVVRYATYPYPWIIIEDTNGNEVSTLPVGSFSNYKFKWHGTETTGLANVPTVTFQISASNNTIAINTMGWTENSVMIEEGDDEWFRTEYETTISGSLTSGTVVGITVVDKEGWYETRNYTVQ